MKLAVVFLCLMPFVLSASVNERFIESLLGGYDIVALAKQLLSQFGTDETEQQCETQLCPPLLDTIDGHNALITHLVCAAVCKEAQVLSSHYLSSAAPIGGK
ncbi:uncharacterized protein LOC127868492 [Dreissena polymorpha]|uniref:Uncharacterized protein n=1 Tax=Dreissena polymorpha TaxID=45954 RepID=A0A9D4RJX1_DREPO|nr:uncharacterized protein LOC127868492 [Dreissena polymorpha]KAH3871411.1 hypothetical protein DPMN_034611 [Dreissena polymorpha]